MRVSPFKHCVALWLFTITFSSACAIFPFNTNTNIGPVVVSHNEKGQVIAPAKTRARHVTHQDLRNGLFVGIAMSGGGSRAANFSAAALLELKELGILDNTTALSSVSGSSLTAAYYGLFSQSNEWNRENVRDVFLSNFERQWFLRWLDPRNIFRYWFSNFDRSNIMEQVFNSILFDGKTFGDMPPDATPKILINATSLTQQRGFLFTDEEFAHIGSPLDKFPVSSAVMASGAFPGAFANVTLRNYTEAERYEHLFDGGPSDNLGVGTLLDELRHVYESSDDANRPKGCFIVIVDAYPESWNLFANLRDTRTGIVEFIVDTNALEASNVLLSLRRREILRVLGHKEDEKIGKEAFTTFKLPINKTDSIECHAWLLTFQRLTHLKNIPHATSISTIVNNVPTRYRLIGPYDLSPKNTQDALFEAARILTREDRETLRKICEKFSGRFGGMKCPQ
jgi:predicted acylesterase/phospholipase RssA